MPDITHSVHGSIWEDEDDEMSARHGHRASVAGGLLVIGDRLRSRAGTNTVEVTVPVKILGTDAKHPDSCVNGSGFDYSITVSPEWTNPRTTDAECLTTAIEERVHTFNIPAPDAPGEYTAEITIEQPEANESDSTRTSITMTGNSTNSSGALNSSLFDNLPHKRMAGTADVSLNQEEPGPIGSPLVGGDLEAVNDITSNSPVPPGGNLEVTVPIRINGVQTSHPDVCANGDGYEYVLRLEYFDRDDIDPVEVQKCVTLSEGVQNATLNIPAPQETGSHQMQLVLTLPNSGESTNFFQVESVEEGASGGGGGRLSGRGALIGLSLAALLWFVLIA